jgi:hypothetical protein
MNDDWMMNAMRLQARLAMSNLAFTRMGTVTAFDPTTYTIQAQIQPVDIDNPQLSLTGFIPLTSPWTGNGWGMFVPPTIGAACLLFFTEASYDSPIAGAMAFNQENLPLAVPSGEFWLVHESGSYIKLTNDGNISISAAIVNLGDISAGNLQKLLNASAANVFNNHTHPGNGEPPEQLMGSDNMTNYTEAN